MTTVGLHIGAAADPTVALDVTGAGKFSTTLTASVLSTAGIVTNTAAGLLGTTATVPVANGGTGAATLTGVLKGNGTSAVTAMNGTANFVSRWTDANTIGTGVIQDNATNVGISTAPSATSRLFITNTLSGAGVLSTNTAGRGMEGQASTTTFQGVA